MTQSTNPPPVSVQAHYDTAAVYQTRPILEYPDFSIIYLGSDDQTPKGTTASRLVNRFSVNPHHGSSQIVEVVSGQLPPAPVEFIVGDQIYTLYTHKLPKRSGKGDRLQTVPGEARFAIFKGKKED